MKITKKLLKKKFIVPNSEMTQTLEEIIDTWEWEAHTEQEMEIEEAIRMKGERFCSVYESVAECKDCEGKELMKNGVCNHLGWWYESSGKSFLLTCTAKLENEVNWDTFILEEHL